MQSTILLTKKNTYILISANKRGINVSCACTDDIGRALELFDYEPFSPDSFEFEGTDEQIIAASRKAAGVFFNIWGGNYDRMKMGNYIDGDSQSEYKIVEIKPDGKVTIYP
jgi:hypothetical protein